MSTIHQTAKPIHGAPVNKTIEAIKAIDKTYTTTPPEGCPFHVGDKVLFTNDYGVKFELEVYGFRVPVSDFLPDNTMYIFTDAYWFPVKPSTCKLLSKAAD